MEKNIYSSEQAEKHQKSSISLVFHMVRGRSLSISTFLSKCRDSVVSLTLINRQAHINFASTSTAKRKVACPYISTSATRLWSWKRKPPTSEIRNVGSNIKTDRWNSEGRKKRKRRNGCARELREQRWMLTFSIFEYIILSNIIKIKIQKYEFIDIQTKGEISR